MARKIDGMTASLKLFSWLGVGRFYGRPALMAWIKAKIRRHFPTVATISTADLASWLGDRSRPAPLLLDARKPAEHAVSHLPGAVLAPTDDTDLKALAAAEPGRPIVAYCSLGYRSAMLAERLAKMGHGDVYNLEGSIFVWANEGRPLYRGEREVRQVHPYGALWGKLFLDRSKVQAVMEP